MTLVVSQALTHGVREGVKVALAPLITDAPIILFSIMLLARMTDSDYFLAGVSFAGGLFLCYLAWESFKTGAFDLDDHPAEPHSVRKGVLVNFLNPNPYLFWFTVGAPIILRAWSQSVVTAGSFLAVFYVCLVGVKCFIAVVMGKSRQFLRGKAYTYIMRFLGVLLMVFALILFRNALHYAC